MNPQPTLAEIYLGENHATEHPDRRIRFAMHFALVSICLILLACGLAVWSGDWQRKRDAEMMELAATQRDLSLRIAMLVVRHDPSGDAEVMRSISSAEASADELEALVGLGDEDRAQQIPVRLAVAAYRAKNLRDAYFEAVRNVVELPPQAKPSKAALDLIQKKGVASVDAANFLVIEIHRYFDQKISAAAQTLILLGFLAFAMILALAFGVVEPTARIIRRSHRTLAKQVEEGRRLALVARRTNNVVVITDAERRIVWANDAFTRLSGYTLEEVAGSRPAHFLHSGLTDPATLAHIRERLDQQQPVRAEILNQAKNDRTYWVDVDIQPLHDDNGVLTGFIAVETDITDQVLQRERLRALLNTLPAGVVEYSAESAAIVDCNDAACHVLGLTRDQMMGRSSVEGGWRAIREDLTPYPGEAHPVHRSLVTGQEFRGEMMGIITGSGDQRWLNVNTAPIRGAEGEITGAVACFVDVTEQRAQRMLLQMALHAANIGTWQWRIDGGEHEWSEASCRMLGFGVDEFRDQIPNCRERIHPADLAKSDAALRAHLEDPTRPYVSEIRMRHREGHWVWVQVFGEVLERDATAEVQRMVGIHIDISDRKRHEDALFESAMSDALTGLPNRSNIMHQIDEVIAQKRKQADRHFGLLFLDFDRFKQVNDSMGHAAGDDLLRQISERLKGALRPGDAVGRENPDNEQVAARLGGDEFVVLLGELQQPADACLVADRLLKTLAVPYTIGGHTIHSSASIGIVHSDLPFEDADGLIRDADTAMYEAKQTGRGRWVLFDPRMREKITQRVGLEADLHDALAREELFVVYQPVVSLNDPHGQEGCAGVEALVRWSHPERGLVPPMQFIPVAEESGLISQLGEFVLRTACRQFMRWQRELGPRAPMLLAVNLSVAQLRQSDLVARVQAAINECGMPAGCLQLEVTESLAAQDPVTQQRLRDLKLLGVRIALDDFGTGYSSLACLHQLPVDTVKIDRSFVAEAERSEYHLALIEATVRVARTLRMKTVAEGIETASQSDLVHTLGCDRGQGYFFSRPLATEQLEMWIKGRTPATSGVVVSLSARRSGAGD